MSGLVIILIVLMLSQSLLSIVQVKSYQRFIKNYDRMLVQSMSFIPRNVREDFTMIVIVVMVRQSYSMLCL